MNKFSHSESVASDKKVWSKPTLVRFGSIQDVAGASSGSTQVSNFRLVTS